MFSSCVERGEGARSEPGRVAQAMPTLILPSADSFQRLGTPQRLLCLSPWGQGHLVGPSLSSAPEPNYKHLRELLTCGQTDFLGCTQGAPRGP